MNQISAKCSCEKVSVQISLNESPSRYQPRACDCDFCTKQNAAYVSDPNGEMKISGPLKKIKQGSETADFNMCAECGRLVAVTFQTFGAVNATLFANQNIFASSISVSPKKLDKEAKVARWKEVWFPKVELIK